MAREKGSKVYVGYRSPGSCDVKVSVVEDGEPRELPMRLDLREHSPEGLEWAYGNKGPAQLALAILADATGSDNYALRHHHWFKLEVVSGLPWESWDMPVNTVMDWIRHHHPLRSE